MLNCPERKNPKSAAKRHKCIESRNAKSYPGEYKNKQLRRSRQARVSSARENRSDTFLRKKLL